MGRTWQNQMLPLGKVVKAQGLRGDIKVAVYSGNPSEFTSLKTVFLGEPSEGRSYSLVKTRDQGKFAILTLSEITDRNTAEAHVGQEVAVARSQMPALSADEFYWHEIVGLKVVTDQGKELGTVTSLIATGGHDVMVVADQGQEYLIPLVQEIVVRQDKESGILVISPMEGLLEMNLPDDAL